LTIIGSNSATQADISKVLSLVSDGSLQPVIAAAFPLAAAAEALRMLRERQNYGRVLLVPAGEAAQ
jgi:alcohol dehydrogenase